MRTTLLVLSSLAILAACSQDGTTTPSQSSHSANGTRASQDAAPNGQGQPSNTGKPNSPFTSITEVNSGLVAWDGVTKVFGAGVATCPPGSYVTGGGYVLNGGADVIVMYNSSFGPNAWRVYAYSHSDASFTVYARCIQ